MKRYIRSDTLVDLASTWVNTPKYHLGPKRQLASAERYGDDLLQVVTTHIEAIQVLEDYLIRCGFTPWPDKRVNLLEYNGYINPEIGVDYVYPESLHLTESANGTICIKINKVVNDDPNRACISTDAFIRTLQKAGFTIVYKHHSWREGYGQGLTISVASV